MLLTPETKNKLLNNVEVRLNDLSSEVDRLSAIFNCLEMYQKFLEERKISNSFDNLKGILNFRIIVGIINLDLCTATLTYCKYP